MTETTRTDSSNDWAEMLTHQECAAKKHPDWFIDSEHNLLCPWCANEDLRARLNAMEALVNEMRATVDHGGRHLVTEVGAERLRAALTTAPAPTPNADETGASA